MTGSSEAEPNTKLTCFNSITPQLSAAQSQLQALSQLLHKYNTDGLDTNTSTNWGKEVHVS